MESAFLCNMQSTEAIKEIIDVFDLMKLKFFYMATNIMSKVKQKNYLLQKYLCSKCQEANFLNIYSASKPIFKTDQ